MHHHLAVSTLKPETFLTVRAYPNINELSITQLSNYQLYYSNPLTW